MITVKNATSIVLDYAVDFGAKLVPLRQAAGYVLAEDLSADRDFPPFDRVTMDGIAIRYRTFANGERDFLIEGTQAAGVPQMKLRNSDNCLEVMTGAILPQGVDTVIRYEDLEIENDIARIVSDDDVREGQNIHRRAHDRSQGALILAPGQLLSPAEIAVAATVGKAQIRVKKTPQVTTIATGDEIVPVEATPLTHQIRTSNTWAISALLAKWKIEATQLHLPDHQERTLSGLRTALNQSDVLILSGGVSEGKFDYVPKALTMLGVKKLFHKVQQRPGKPFWFGQAPNGTVVFALPGNPVSAFMCTVRYLEPWLRASLGLSPMEKKIAALAEDVVFKPNLTYFLQVQITTDDLGRPWAKPVAGGGSGDLANLTEADGFLELPAGRERYAAGEVFAYWGYR